MRYIALYPINVCTDRQHAPPPRASRRRTKTTFPCVINTVAHSVADNFRVLIGIPLHRSTRRKAMERGGKRREAAKRTNSVSKRAVVYSQRNEMKAMLYIDVSGKSPTQRDVRSDIDICITRCQDSSAAIDVPSSGFRAIL